MKHAGKKLAASIAALVFALCVATTGVFAWFGAGDATSQTNGGFASVSVVAQFEEKDYGRTVASRHARSEADTVSTSVAFEGEIIYTLKLTNFSAGAVKLSFSADAPIYFNEQMLNASDALTLQETGGTLYTFEMHAQTACTVTLTFALV